MANANLQVRITAELGQIRSALTSLQAQLTQAKTTGGQIGQGAAQGIGQLNNRLATTGRIVAGLAASLGAGLSVAGLIRASDEAQTISARLKLATKDAKSFEQAQRGVFEIAQRTRTSLLASVELYGRIERSTRDIGVNQATILQLTETINQAAQISGGGAGAEAALFQLSQGLASGTLRGEELNSILEQTPRLAQAIADGMDLPIGKLRAVAQEGKLTSEAVLKALLDQSKEIQSEFAEFPPTIASGFTVLRNAMVQYLQTSQTAGTAANDLARFMGKLAENLPTIINAFIRLAPVAVAAYVAMRSAALASAIIGFFGALPPLITKTATSFTLLQTSALGAMGKVKVGLGVLIAAFAGWQVGTLLKEQFLIVEVAGISLVTGLLKIKTRLAVAFAVLGISIREAFVGAFNFVLGKASTFYTTLASGMRQIPGVGDKLGGVFDGLAAKIEGAKLASGDWGLTMSELSKGLTADLEKIDISMADATEAAIAARKAGEIAAGGGAVGIPGGGGGGGNGNGTKEAAALAAANADLVQDAVRRSLAALDVLYEDAKVPMVEYFAEKSRLELEGVDAAIEAAEAERAAAKTAGEVAAANVTLIKLYRDRGEIGTRVAREQKKAEEELARELGAVHIRLLAANGETSRARMAELEEEFKNLKERLLIEGDAAGVALVNKLINREAFKAAIDQVGSTVSSAMSRFQNVETSVGAQVQAGMLGQSDGEDRVAEARATALADLTTQRDLLMEVAENARLANDTMSETEALDQLAQVNGQIAQLSINTESLGYKAAEVLKGALTQLFTDLASGSKSAGDALKDFVRNFAAGMAQIAANALATYLVLQLLDAIYPGLGKATAALTAAGSNHSGGIAGSGGSRRMIPTMAIAGAPRYHSGGVAGVGPNEVVSVLEKGEEVLTKNDPRHRNNGGRNGGGESITKQPIVAFGDRAIADALMGADGEEMVVTHMRNNWEALQRESA